MRFVIVTGVSGAGKTAALKMLEDMGYFCVDNLPIQLLEKFASLLPEMQSENVRNVALGIDARSGSALDELEVVLDRMKQTGYDYEILFMDAEDSVLVKRYKESRRSHPLARTGEWMRESAWNVRKRNFSGNVRIISLIPAICLPGSFVRKSKRSLWMTESSAIS